MNKICGKCREDLPVSSFYVYKISKSKPNGGLHSYCKTCSGKATRASAAKRPKEELRTRDRIRVKAAIDRKAAWYVNYLARHKTKWAAQRLEVLAAYGNVCACCKEDIPEFLTIDHINGDGAAHRKKIGGTGRFYEWLRKNNYPRDGFQLLCWNCNRGKSMNGNICPHIRR